MGSNPALMPADFASTIHLAGFVTGIALYGMLLLMTARLGAAANGETSAGHIATAFSGIMPYGVGVLGLIWNVTALVFFASRDFGLGSPSPWLGAVGFAALGFLPAVVVHSAIPQMLPGRGKWVLAPAYTVSTMGAVLQFVSAAQGVVPSRSGLVTMTIGYSVILTVMLLSVSRAQQGWQKSLFVVALAAFAVSALHLSRPEAHGNSWPVELLGHHASLALVLVILYQDYRFAFADLFLRRALSLVALVSVAVTLHVLVSEPAVSGAPESLLSTMRHIGLWVATALAYPHLRDLVGKFVDRVVLDRVDYVALRDELSIRLEDTLAIDELIEATQHSIRLALGARRVAIEIESEAAVASRYQMVSNVRDGVRMRIPTTDAPHYILSIGDLAGGRRLLSDDHALLEWIVTTLARRIDLVRVSNERFERDIREREILSLATEAELRALRAQLNPHFLFNALTTIGFLLQTSPERALQTLYRLTHLLRAVLRRSTGSFITLGEELELVESYLAIESARFEERLTVIIDVPDVMRETRIPPLLLQPLVENAIKHGIAPIARGGAVTVSARIRTLANTDDQTLVLEVTDTGAGLSTIRWRESDGVGIANIESRLQRYYGERATFSLTQGAVRGVTATVSVPINTAESVSTSLKAAS